MRVFDIFARIFATSGDVFISNCSPSAFSVRGLLVALKGMTVYAGKKNPVIKVVTLIKVLIPFLFVR